MGCVCVCVDKLVNWKLKKIFKRQRNLMLDLIVLQIRSVACDSI